AEVEEDPGARVRAQPSGTAGGAILDVEGVDRTSPSGIRERQPSPVGAEDRPVRARCNRDRLLDSAGPQVPDLQALHERVVRLGRAAQSEATVPAEPGKEVVGRPENKWWRGRTAIEPPALDDLVADVGASYRREAREDPILQKREVGAEDHVDSGVEAVREDRSPLVPARAPDERLPVVCRRD